MQVSVCLPTFNGAAFVENAIQSVLRQTWSEYELYVADDCSTDGTFEIVQRLAKDNNKIICWRNETRLGLFANYNLCMQRAAGQLIKPMGQDDSLTAEAVQKMADEFARDSSLALVCADRALPPEGSQYAARKEHRRSSLAPGKISGSDAIRQCLSEQCNLIGEPVAVMFPRRLLGTGFDTSYHSLGDLDLWLRLCRQGAVVHLAETLVTFQEHDGSTTSNLLRNMDWVLDFFRLSKAYEQEIAETGATREQFCLRFVEDAGTLIDELIKQGRLEMDELDGYREVAFYAMRRCAELGFKSREYDAIVRSTSWRITRPVRFVMRGFKK